MNHPNLYVLIRKTRHAGRSIGYIYYDKKRIWKSYHCFLTEEEAVVEAHRVAEGILKAMEELRFEGYK